MRAIRRQRGFSLAELLTVMGIIGVLVTLSVPALKGVTESTAMTQALTRVAGAMEATRSYAVANNTHAWVAFTENAQNADSTLEMVAFASRSGLDLDPDGTGTVLEYPSEDIEIISPIERIKQIRLDGKIPEENALRTDTTLPAVGELTEFSETALGLQLRFQNKIYTRSIHFKPSGEAAITAMVPEVIQMVVVPEKNPGVEPTEKDMRQASVIRVSGLTGQALVYQPR